MKTNIMVSRHILPNLVVLFFCVQLASFQPISSCQNSVNTERLQSGTYTLANRFPQSTRANAFNITVNYVIPPSGL